MCRCRLLRRLVWWVVPVMVLSACRTGPAVDDRIDFDRFPSDVPVDAHCPDQDRLLAGAESFFAQHADARALQAATQVIADPCSRKNYTQALKIAGDVFTQRQEFGQAFYFYLEGLVQAKDARETRVFSDAVLASAVHLPADEIIAAADAAGAGETIAGIWVTAGAAKLAQQEAEDAEALFLAVVDRFAGTPEAKKAGAMLEQMHKAAAFKTDRIGVLLPLSGFYQAAGERALNGIRVAVEAQHRSGEGRFQLLVRDTGSDPAGVAAAVRHLESRGAACIIGPMVTAAAAAVQAQALGIPMIALSQEQGVTEAGEFIFQHFLTPERQAGMLVSHVTSETGPARFVVLYPENRYGQRFSRAFEQAVEESDGQVTAGVSYEPGQTDFSSLIRPLIRGYQKLDLFRNFVDMAPGESREKNRIYRAVIDADAVFVPDDSETAAQIALQLRFHDIRDVTLLGPNIWNQAAMDRVWGEAPLPVVFPVAFDPDDPEEAVQAFVAAYEAAFEETPDYFASIGFEAAMQVMACLSDPRVTSRSVLQQKLRQRI
ncbi:MAG: penicillin-binding protein activator [Desulfotignum sp.]|nr:penicillin-binding protein activator [Desulfotignum sp.]